MAERRFPLLVEPSELRERLDEPGLLIVDLNSPDDYRQRHIPGAVNLPYAQLLRQAPPAMGLMPDTDSLSAILSGIGLRSDLHVLAYDGEGNGRASRLLWTLDALGHFDYSLIDGGLEGWVADGGEVWAGESRPERSEYHATLANPDVVSDRTWILGHLEDPGTLLLDARSPAEFRGEDVRAARGGHIPGAVNVEWTTLQNPGRQRRLLPAESLRALLKQAGVTPDRKVVAYCQTHHRSALVFFALRYLGYPDVSGYPGSWSDWGNNPDAPVATGE